jgi:hypothetical protein
LGNLLECCFFQEKKMKFVKILFLVAVTAVVAGCAGPVPRIEASPESLATIKTLAVIRPMEPQRYTIYDSGKMRVAGMFGLAGGTALAVEMMNQEKQMTEVIKKHNDEVISSALANNIVLQLQRRGFNVRAEDGPWKENDSKDGYTIAQINSTADAVLVVAPRTIGFFNFTSSMIRLGEFRPTVWVEVTLVGRDRSHVLYKGFHAVGWKPQNVEGWRYEPSDVSLENLEAIMEDPVKASNGLADAASKIAVMIAEDLKR